MQPDDNTPSVKLIARTVVHCTLAQKGNASLWVQVNHTKIVPFQKTYANSNTNGTGTVWSIIFLAETHTDHFHSKNNAIYIKTKCNTTVSTFWKKFAVVSVPSVFPS